MAVIIEPIFTQEVGSGGAASITFNNIPQTYKHLKLVVSGRSNHTALSEAYLRFNGDTATNYSFTRLYGSGVNTASDRQSSITQMSTMVELPGTNFTGSGFSQVEILIPGYNQSTHKSVFSRSHLSNTTTSNLVISMTAGLWRNSNAISSISITPNAGSFVQYSTLSLYGIIV